MEQIFADYCRKHNMDPNNPVFYWIEKRFEHQANKSSQASAQDIRRELFEEIRATMVPPLILSEFIQRTVPSFASRWAFRSNFVRHHAVMSFAARALYLVRGAPHTMNIALNSGAITYSEACPNYDDNVVVSVDRVFFRMTPNIVKYLGGDGVVGPFSVYFLVCGQVMR